MKKRYYVVSVTLAALLTIGALFYLTTLKAEEISDFQNGDIIFHTSTSNQAAAIMLASQSPYTHMGLIKRKDDGSVVVVEATATVRETPVKEWIDRGVAKRISVRRFNGITPKQQQKVLAAAEKYYGKPYDALFLFDKDKIYCSELVFYAFDDALNITLGNIEMLEQLNIDNFLVKKLISKRWQRHPSCKQQTTLEACMQILKKQEMITPVSIAADPRLKTVFNNFDLLK